MNDNYGLIWAPSTSPESTTSNPSYSWYTPTTAGLPTACTGYSPSITSSTISTPALGHEGLRRSRSPMTSLGIDLLEGMSMSETKLNRDGQPSKRRGPKPDRQPAMTRRQELNRLAQRTHRLKKENEMRALERQNVQLKQLYADVVEERDALFDENQKLKDLLQAKGIFMGDLSTAPSLADSQNLPTDHAAAYANSGSLLVAGPGSSSIGMVPSMSQVNFYPETSLMSNTQQQQQQSNMLNYEPLAAEYLLRSTPRTISRSTSSRPRSYHSPNPQDPN